MLELNEARIGAAKPKERPYTLRNGRGLHLLITPASSSGALSITANEGAADHLDRLRDGSNVVRPKRSG